MGEIENQQICRYLSASIGPIGSYALNRVLPFTDYYKILHITSGGLAKGIREDQSIKYSDNTFNPRILIRTGLMLLFWSNFLAKNEIRSHF